MYIRESYLTAVKRVLEPRGRIQVLLGPRQVGKTTGARYVIERVKEEQNIEGRLAAADQPELRDRNWLAQQWKLGRQECKKLGKPYLLVIDEVQKIEGWSELVKRFWDEDTLESIDLRVVLLGSSTLLVHDGLTESLAGRFEIIPVTHWLYKEMKEAFQFTWEEWVYYGGYPGAAELRKEPERWAAYIRDALIETTISRDILLLEKINKPALLRRLFQIGCHYSGQILSFQKIMGQLQDAGNASTLAHYLDLLSQAGLLMGLEKYSGTTLRQKASSPKLQVMNPALASALGSLSFEELRADPERWGRAVESAVGAHLAIAIAGKNSQLTYWRDRDLEVDFVLKMGERCVAFEVKSGAKIESHSGISEFEKKFNPVHSWIVGDSYGLPFETFFSTSIESWW